MGVAMLLAGCGSDPRPATIPTPSFSCTPDPAGAPCTAELAAAQAEETRAYAEAEFAYREFTKERNRLLQSGGSVAQTSQMERYATGPYLEEMANDLKIVHDNGLKSTGEITVGNFGRKDSSSDRLEFYLCEDASAVRVFDSTGKQISQGRLGALRVIAVGGDGERKIEDTELAEEWKCL
ncbi:hypothetical protein SDC9_97497 [bioreactor metagenome]|uniref:Uncharacterized protein n=2 Tax=root TaxID=1 RepID=A0A645AMA4_9ZZZZ